MSRCRSWLPLLLAGVTATAAAAGEARLPRDESEVVAVLPSRPAGPPPSQGGGPAAGIEQARAQVAEARRYGDPRPLGRAEAIWLDLPPGLRDSPDGLVLAAAIRQTLHEFDAALGLLDEALDRDPRHAQALLDRAALHLLQGRREQASRDCAALWRMGAARAARICAAAIAVRGPDPGLAVAPLEALLVATPREDAALRAWIHELLAEATAHGGDAAAAERHLLLGLAALPDDVSLLAAYSDLLLAQHRHEEVARILGRDSLSDGLLLRRALAHAVVDPARARSDRAELEARFATSRAAGRVPHLREEARFALEIAGDAGTALGLARENWQVQREPADARLLREAAARAGAAP